MTTFDEYRDLPGINWSSLKQFHHSARMFRYYQNHPSPDKPAYALGRAVHCAILEPDRFDADHVVYDGKVRRGKAWDAFKEEYAGKEILKPGEMAQVEVMREAVLDHVAGEYFTGGRSEVNLEWNDGPTGLTCKGRADYIRGPLLIDLKTARDVDPRRFARAAADYLYHGQMAYYFDGAQMSGDLPEPGMSPLIVAVQSQPPWDVAVYQITDDQLQWGRNLYRSYLDQLAAGLESDVWPGVAPDVVPLELPEWAAGSEASTAPALTMGGKEMKF